MFVRISYTTMVGGIIGGVWCLGWVQREDLRLRQRGLPAPVLAQHSQAENADTEECVADAD